MKIIFASSFNRDLKRLDKNKRSKIDKAITTFKENPFNSKLKNHKLKGEFRNIRSFSADYDLRILYREENGHAIIIMLRVGKHEEVY